MLGILVLRTSALYNNDRRVKYGLGFLMFLMAVNGVVRHPLLVLAYVSLMLPLK